MVHQFHLPDIGEGLVEATIVSWYVDVGDTVGLDEPLVEVETDKAIIDIPSPFAGVLVHRGGENGDTVEVDSLLAVIGEPGERWRDSWARGSSALTTPRFPSTSTRRRTSRTAVTSTPT